MIKSGKDVVCKLRKVFIYVPPQLNRRKQDVLVSKAALVGGYPSYLVLSRTVLAKAAI